MKHRTVLEISALVVFCLLVALVPSGLSATTWLTYREDVAIDSGTVDIDNISYHNGTTTETYRNVTLPCPISNLSQTLTQFRIKNENATNSTFNLTVNSNAVNASSLVNWTMGNWSNITLAMMVSAGVTDTDTYLNFTFDVNNSANDIHIRIYADDANFTSSWLSSNVVVKEKDVTSPSIGTTSARSYWVVNDSIAVSHSIGYTLSDVNLTPTFSSQTITAPATYYNVGSIATGGSTTTYAQYQKRGPYLYDVDDDSTGTSHEVSIYIQTNELLTSCVDWSVDISDAEYDDAFEDINYDTLDVELNSIDVDWEEGSIDMEDLTIKSSYSNNKFTFTWTETAIPATATPEAWYMTLFLGLAVYLWITIIIAVIVILALILLIRKKK